jgi:glycosyltransferase involved in cell wall biosynthesis
MNPSKIALLFYDINSSAGIQRALTNLANGFQEFGHSVTIIVASHEVNPFYKINHDVEVITLDLPSIRSSGPLSWGLKILWAIRFHFKILKLMKVRHFDCLIDHGTSWGMIYPKNRIGKTKIVFQRHFSGQGFPFSGLFFRVISHLNFSKNLVVLTEGIKKQFNNYGFTNVISIPNFVEIDESFINPQHELVGDNYALSVGRSNTPQKGFDLLIESLSKIQSWPSDFIFRIIGPGITRDEKLIDLLLAYGIKDKVVLMESSSDIYSIIKNAKFLVISSRYEGLPMVCLESISLSTPVIGFAIDGVKDIVNPKNGVLVEPFDTIELAKKIEQYSNEELRLNDLRLNMKKTVSHFSKAKVVFAWNDYIETLS